MGAAWALGMYFIALMDLEPGHKGSVPLYPTHPEAGWETWTATARLGTPVLDKILNWVSKA